jgi:hypothetical protein
MAKPNNPFKKLAKDRNTLISRLLDQLDRKVGEIQSSLLSDLLQDVADRLDVDENGRIKNTVANRYIVNKIDTVFDKWIKKNGVGLAATLVDGVSELVTFNAKYFSAMESKTKLAPINKQVIESLNGWLGIEGNKVARNGYLDTIIRDPQVKNLIKDSLMKSVVSQNGWFETKKNFKDFLTDTPERTGKMKQYYRNFTYDLYSQADRTAGKITADKLGLEYAIYEGGLIETSRQFCIDHNGTVYTREEIEKFDPPEAKQPDYNPFIDLGGYGCRHHLNWIPKIVAFALRPELRAMAA